MEQQQKRGRILAEEPLPLVQPSASSPPPPNEGWLSQKLHGFSKFLKDFPTPHGFGWENPLMLIPRGINALVAGTADTLAHPLENAPQIGGTIGGAVGTVLGGPPGGVAGGTIGAGAGSVVKTTARGVAGLPIPPWQEAVGETLLEGPIMEMAGGAPVLLGRGARGVARSSAGQALHPSSQVLADVIDPGTGQPFRRGGSAAYSQFKDDALTASKKRVGSDAYVEDVNMQIHRERGKKVGALIDADSRGVLVDKNVVKKDFEDLLKAAAASPDPEGAEKVITEELEKWLDRRRVDPQTQNSRTGLPMLMPDKREQFTPSEVDDFIQGLDKKLREYYEGVQLNQRIPTPTGAEEVQMKIRANLHDELTAKVPDIGNPDRRMRRMMPVADAAGAANARPGANAPSIRVGGGGRTPFALFDYLSPRTLGSLFAHPARRTGEALSTAATPSRNIARFLEWLQSDEPATTIPRPPQ